MKKIKGRIYQFFFKSNQADENELLRYSNGTKGTNEFNVFYNSICSPQNIFRLANLNLSLECTFIEPEHLAEAKKRNHIHLSELEPYFTKNIEKIHLFLYISAKIH